MVGLIEPVAVWIEEHKGFPRHKAAVVAIGAVAVLSIFSILSYNALSEFQILGKDLNSTLDYFSNQILLPVGGFLIAVFVGWFISRNTSAEELGLGDGAMFGMWHFAIRYIVPPAVLAIFIVGVTA